MEQQQQQQQQPIRYVRSFFIPSVFVGLSLQYVADKLEHTLRFGKVGRIEAVPRRDGTSYKCFVYFLTWNGDSFIDKQSTTTMTKQGDAIRAYYAKGRYWTLCRNTSHLQHYVYSPPKHMDLLLTIPNVYDDDAEGVVLEHIENVMEALDLGKVMAIVIMPGRNYHNHNHNHNYNRIIRIQYEYWYRTRTAIAFQKLMMKDGVVKYPVTDHVIWEFRETEPVTNGISPWIYHVEIPPMPPLSPTKANVVEDGEVIETVFHHKDDATDSDMLLQDLEAEIAKRWDLI